MKKVYVGMCADLIHHGHMNIIKEAQKYGSVVVGLLTDSAIASYKRMPALNYKQRKMIIENIKGVDEVIPQKSLDYIPNLELIKPAYVVHGDDWKEGVQKQTRQKVVNKLQEWGGKVIDVKALKESPYNILNSAAIKAAKNWIFAKLNAGSHYLVKKEIIFQLQK